MSIERVVVIMPDEITDEHIDCSFECSNGMVSIYQLTPPRRLKAIYAPGCWKRIYVEYEKTEP